MPRLTLSETNTSAEPASAALRAHNEAARSAPARSTSAAVGAAQFTRTPHPPRVTPLGELVGKPTGCLGLSWSGECAHLPLRSSGEPTNHTYLGENRLERQTSISLLERSVASD